MHAFPTTPDVWPKKVPMARDWLVGILRNLNAKQDQEPTFAVFIDDSPHQKVADVFLKSAQVLLVLPSVYG